MICQNLKVISTPQKTDEIWTASLFAGKFQKFSERWTIGEAALPTHNEERKAFQVWGGAFFTKMEWMKKLDEGET